jgi:hypothetical protein
MENLSVNGNGARAQWQHCDLKTPMCEHADPIYARTDQLKGMYCLRDA